MVASHERPEGGRRTESVAAVVGVVLVLVTLIDLIARGPLRDWDHHVIGTAHQAGSPEPVLWQAVADIGGVGVLSVVLIAVALTHLFLRRPIAQLVIAGAWILVIEAVIWLTKIAVGRTPPRSHVDHLAAGGRSWPSGHTAAGLALLLIAATLLTRPGSRLDRIAYWNVPVIAAGIAAATVDLDYHWPTDAIAGWALGLTLGILARRLVRSVDAPSTVRCARVGRSAPRRSA